MKKLITLFLCLSLTAAISTGCGSKSDSLAENSSAGNTAPIEEPASDAEQTKEPLADTYDTTQMEELLSGLHHIEIDIADYGVISLELDADTAPITVTNFINLAKDGFYDGLTFHRIIKGFMIQGGDPLGNGMGGADNTIKGEFSNNGVENDISHRRGVISMARSASPDSASSQFFIVHQDSGFLDKEYAAFGHVTEGIEIVDQICDDTPVEDNNGTVAPENQPTISSVTVID